MLRELSCDTSSCQTGICHRGSSLATTRANKGEVICGCALSHLHCDLGGFSVQEAISITNRRSDNFILFQMSLHDGVDCMTFMSTRLMFDKRVYRR